MFCPAEGSRQTACRQPFFRLSECAVPVEDPGCVRSKGAVWFSCAESRRLVEPTVWPLPSAVDVRSMKPEDAPLWLHNGQAPLEPGLGALPEASSGEVADDGQVLTQTHLGVL